MEWTCEDCRFELVQDIDLLCKSCKNGLCAFVSKTKEEMKAVDVKKSDFKK